MDPDHRLDLRPLPRAERGQQKYRSLQRAAALAGRRAARGWVDEGTDVYGYFNNDYDGAAVEDATWFRDPGWPAARPRVAAAAVTLRS